MLPGRQRDPAREAGEQTTRRAHAVQPVSVLQTEYSLFEHDVEALFPVLHELGSDSCPIRRSAAAS